ncbi:hypothetical protein KVR01_002892 [Diaporthe batatas]|uniref:uncharacterized protein n=1 Tax=Diaporthe batatas TaxID=748121 RepID=UPI001D051998|nr:uncharacterized protein KVR01_002892 [Diaporthe batatas]KAG8167203.1 hypothetical protein KVR01_002892 [Diaporthe batatas]
MATSTKLSLTSRDTALCIIPPRNQWTKVDQLRSHYDRAYGKWPPHVNLVYPFVQVDALPRAAEAVQSAAAPVRGQKPLDICLDAAGVFQHKQDKTIYIHDEDDSQLKDFRAAIMQALGHQDAGSYNMHMTIGQSEDMNESWHQFLLQKARWLPKVEWSVDQLYILIREKLPAGGSEMKTWAIISLDDGSISRCDTPKPFFDELPAVAEKNGMPYSYLSDSLWSQSSRVHYSASPSAEISNLVVSSYNVLAEFEYPPSQARYPLIVRNVLSDSARADVLVLEEVTDDFLVFLLREPEIRELFTFCSWGPPDQEDVQPLPSHNNIVVLSKHAFTWEHVPFHREHKGAIVAQFQSLGQWDDADFRPLILAAVHLTHGLKDGSVAAKKMEIETILRYLDDTYPENPTILTGDFNITTSSYTINQALEKKAVTPQSITYLRNIEETFVQSGFVDTWAELQVEDGAASDDELDAAFEGEQGATYDPITNALTAEIVGSGFNMRPQRYDRILVRAGDYLKALKFDKFGFATEEIGKFASDHWGVRAVFRIGPEAESQEALSTAADITRVKLKTGKHLSETEDDLAGLLKQLQAIPSEGEVQQHAAAFKLLRETILESPAPTVSTETGRSSTPLVLVPVGSYGLGVWTSASDIDCLCIGPFSSSTFFSLATQRLRKAADKGVKVMRRVKAHTGTMLELEVNGIKVDLQYAPAGAIAAEWPHCLRLPASDPVWSLSAQTLNKLKSIRDLDYVRRSVPDIVKFRLAHRLVKTWAKRRGIYALKYGYLGGIPITVLLARIHKLLARDSGVVSLSDLLSTFFNHYAGFNWRADVAFDPFFHKQLNYRRTDREALAILGYAPPALNTCLAASVPSVRTIAEEFQRADEMLSEEGMTWSRFFETDGSADFLKSYKSYIKINVQFWGGSLTKGRGLVGWLESRCVSLLVDLNRRLPDLHVRFWPARFVEASAGDSTEDEQGDYEGFYLVGLDRLEGSATDEKTMQEKLLDVLRKFEDQIRGDPKYYDERTSWVEAGVIRRAALKQPHVDAREWGEYTIGDEESDEEEEEEEEAAQGSSVYEDYQAVHSAAKKGRTTNQPRSVVVSKPAGAGKFRTASDVLNRLRWDPSLDSGDFIVGYEDRFAGAMEKALDTWKSEQTDEEFIPQHRILYFKRRSDATVVWERRTRIDLLFGSGGGGPSTTTTTTTTT